MYVVSGKDRVSCMCVSGKDRVACMWYQVRTECHVCVYQVRTECHVCVYQVRTECHVCVYHVRTECHVCGTVHESWQLVYQLVGCELIKPFDKLHFSSFVYLFHVKDYIGNIVHTRS